MRIACIYLPSFPLQVHARLAPHLAGTSFAVVDGRAQPAVVACSRRAWEQGVRPGMKVTRARTAAPGLELRDAIPEHYGRALESLAESLLSLSVAVDTGGLADRADKRDHALYLRVPTGTRGVTFGAKILSLVSRQGFRGRVGIADDRFSAWVAAAIRCGRPSVVADEDATVAPFTQTCTAVPRGGSAAFLAPLPLSLLPMDGDVRSMLETLGVTTIGDFAALPPPSSGMRWNDTGADIHALSRGDDPTPLVGFSPQTPIVECVELEHPVGDAEPLGFMLRPLFDRICERLRGRGSAARRVALRLHSETGRVAYTLEPRSPTLSGRALLDVARALLASKRLTAPVLGIEVAVMAEAEPQADELELFDDQKPESVFSLSPFMSPARESHRRTMRGNRGKKNRRRKKSDGTLMLRGLFD